MACCGLPWRRPPLQLRAGSGGRLWLLCRCLPVRPFAVAMPFRMDLAPEIEQDLEREEGATRIKVNNDTESSGRVYAEGRLDGVCAVVGNMIESLAGVQQGANRS